MTTLERLRGGLIVSCQAPEGSPMDRPAVIAALAAAAERAGAKGVRINRPENIRAVRTAVRVPIIGIYKKVQPGSDVYITPDFDSAREVAGAGADIIALDATPRRPDGYTAAADLIARIRAELKLPVMADISTLVEGRRAAAAGADLVATTLFGYTQQMKGASLPALELVSQLAESMNVPIVCEGGVQSPEQVAQAFASGAFAVVVGTAITGIEANVRHFAAAAPSH